MMNHDMADGPDVDGAYLPEVLNPEGRFPCMIVCDHASSRVPPRYGHLGLDPTDLEKHIGIDIGIASVVRELAARLDAPAVLSPCSRLLVDCNRWIEDPRCILAESDGIRVPGNIGLSAEQKTARFDAYFWPYHCSVRSVLARLIERTRKPYFLALHSCTRQIGSGARRAMDGGTIWHESNAFSAELTEKLSVSAGFVIGDNAPYSGIGGTFTIDYHTWGTGVSACGLEIVNDHLTTPEGHSRWVEALAQALKDIAGSLAKAPALMSASL